MTHPADPAIDGSGHATLSVASILSESAVRHADRPALHFAGAQITYRELWDQTRAYAGALRARGIRRGDRVAIMIPNVPDFPRVYYAALAVGAVVVPVHLLLKHDEVVHVLKDSGADLLVAAAPVLAIAGPAAAEAAVPLVTVLAPTEADVRRLEAEAAEAEPIVRHEAVGPLEPATILYTSGTTGTPKGAVSSHLSIIEQVHTSLIDAFPFGDQDILFGGLPLFHTFGQTVVMNMSFRAGASVILLPKFEPEAALELMASLGATIFAAVPTMYVGMIEAARRSDQRPPLKYAISGGAALPVAVLDAFNAEFGVDVHEGYGLTETTPVVAVNAYGAPINPGTVGRAIWGVEIAIADPEVDDRIVVLGEPGALGEVIVRGHNVFKGYLGRPEATAQAVVDGWFRTGDLGTYVEGMLTIVDRKKDMIVRNGYNVYPTEVEAVLARHPAIAQAAVFGVADDVHDQEIHVAIVPLSGETVDEAEIVEYVKERVAAYKYPRVVHVLDALPLGPSGKVLKRDLVTRFS